MPIKHARCSASSAYRWINCPGSVALAEQCPESGSSSYADEGTLAHTLGELKLRRQLQEISEEQYKKKLQTITEDEYYDNEMDEATDFYAETVLEEFMAAGDGAELMIEQQLDLSKWIPEGFGTADAVIISDTYIQVIDLKYGRGIKVNASNNPQLSLYGLGAAALFRDIYDFETVKTTVVQPRLDYVSTETVPLSELLLWGREKVTPRAVMAMEGTGYLSAGDWCRWCPAKSLCRKRAEHNLELAKDEFKSPQLMSDEEIGEVLQRADELQKWAADIRAYALQQALAGRQFKGWKLAEGRSSRKYADDNKVAEALKAANYDESMLYERKLYSVAAMEKLIGKKKLTDILGDLIVKPSGKPVLVPESEQRGTIGADAKTDFNNITDEMIHSF